MRITPTYLLMLSRFALAILLMLIAVNTRAATVMYPFGTTSIAWAREPFALNELNLTSCRYQQVYDAARFAAILPDGGALPDGGTITQLMFVVDNEFFHGFNTAFPDIQIDFSVTPRSPDQLSTNFSDNLGTNTVAVFPRGRLSMQTTGGPGTPVVINLPVAYFYNPAQGNLLLDVRIFLPNPQNPSGNPGVFDAFNSGSDSVSRVFSPDVTSPTGVADTMGLTTIFKVVPPPIPRLRVQILDGYLWLRWFRVPGDYTLEQSSILGPDALWQPAGGLVGGGGEDSILVRLPLFPPDAGRFFRLVSTNHPSASAPAGLNTNQPALLNPPD